MHSKRNRAEKIFDCFNALFMVLLVIITLYPFWFITAASFSDPEVVLVRKGIMLAVERFTTASYELVFKNPNIWIGYKNTLIYMVLGTSVNLLMTTLGAYALSRKNLYGSRVFLGVIVFTMVFNGGMIPTFLIVRNLGFVDKIWAMIIPGAINTYNLFVMRTSFQGIPSSLEESARIDGAHDFTIMWRIIVPLSLPVMAVITLFYAVGHWNSFFPALLYLRKRELFPLQVVLREILIINDLNEMMLNQGISATDRNNQALNETVKYATIIVSTIPILLLYPYLQRFFVKGVMIGSLKE